MLDSLDFSSIPDTYRRIFPSFTSVTNVSNVARCLGEFPTLPDDGGAVRIYFVSADAVEVSSSAGFWGSADPPGGSGAAFPGPYPSADIWMRFFPIKRDTERADRIFVARTSRLNVPVPSEVQISDRDFNLRLELPVFWIDVDLAEFVVEATRGHTLDSSGLNAAAVAALSEPNLIAYSKQMADPRKRQGISIWWKDGETVGATIERALKSTDAVAAFSGLDPTGSYLDLSFSLATVQTASVLTTPISLADGGAADRISGDVEWNVSSEWLINRLRRTVGGSVTQGNLTPYGGYPSSVVTSELGGKANLIELEDATSVSLYGVQEREETFEVPADVGHAIGDMRLAPWVDPARNMPLPMGPIAHNFCAGDVIFVEDADLGLTGTERLFVAAIEYDLDGTQNVADLVELGGSRDPSAGLDHGAIYAAYSCKETEPSASAGNPHAKWVDEKTSGTARDADDFATTIPTTDANPLFVASATLDGTKVLEANGAEGYLLENVDDEYEAVGRPWGFAALVKIPQDDVDYRVILDTRGARHALPYTDAVGGCWAEDIYDRLTVLIRGGRIYWIQSYGDADETGGISPLVDIDELTDLRSASPLLPDDEWVILVVAFDFAPQFGRIKATGSTANYDADHLDHPAVLQTDQLCATVFCVDPETGEILTVTVGSETIPVVDYRVIAAYEGRHPPLMRDVSLFFPYPGFNDASRKGFDGLVADLRIWQFDQNTKPPLSTFLGGIVADIRQAWNYG